MTGAEKHAHFKIFHPELLDMHKLDLIHISY